MKGDEDNFVKWQNENKDKWDNFVSWFKDNGLKFDEVVAINFIEDNINKKKGCEQSFVSNVWICTVI